ncbi:MAG: prephenate dehydrogenase, partial [Clostridia bacterium]|nr:prephenate dehydrogenase [Clostridia bacterium]
KEYSLALGFGKVVMSTAEEHDRIIAFTSQLAHLVSSAYVKSDQAQKSGGFSAGSFRDMTRVAKLSPEMWAELTLDNADHLTDELDKFIKHLQEYREALFSGDKDQLVKLLEDGNRIKIDVEKTRRKG